TGAAGLGSSAGAGAAVTSFSEIGGTASGAGVGTLIGGGSSEGPVGAAGDCGGKGVGGSGGEGGCAETTLAPRTAAAAASQTLRLTKRTAGVRRDGMAFSLLRGPGLVIARGPLPLAAARERALRPVGVDGARQVRQVVLLPGLDPERLH